MSLSLFETDNTLGNVSAASYGPGLDDFSVRISGRFVREVPQAIQYVLAAAALWASGRGQSAAGIAALLNSKNWLITRADDESGWTGDYIYKLQGVIGSHYSNEQIRTQIQNDLAGLFTVSGVTVLSRSNPNPSAAPVYNAGNLGTVTVYGSDPGGYQSTGGAVAPGGSSAGSSNTDFLGSLGMGLGVSTPVVLLGGAVLLVLLMRR